MSMHLLDAMDNYRRHGGRLRFLRPCGAGKAEAKAVFKRAGKIAGYCSNFQSFGAPR
ncbi:MAG: hypothetical protein QOD29_3113 [Alphaproteobacteria bacterium]|jgi:hypothetical protein|nr:hypothetical protein [Alphaproteobacteria bacterium]